MTGSGRLGCMVLVVTCFSYDRCCGNCSQRDHTCVDHGRRLLVVSMVLSGPYVTAVALPAEVAVVVVTPLVVVVPEV